MSITKLGTTLALTATLSGLALSAQAVQLADGTVYFTQPPFLIKAVTTLKGVDMWGSTYYFTLNVPSTAGEPLQKVTIAQKQGAEDIKYELKQTEAFEGRGHGQKFTLGEVTKERKTGVVSVTFNPPIPPGKTVTLGLHPDRNPRFEGVYLFGVTAFPPGEKAHGQFLGFGRLTFYGNNFR